MNITPILVMHIHNSVGLNICPYFWSYSPSLNSTGNKTEKNLLVLISFGLKKPVGLNILVESVLICSVLVTGPVCNFCLSKYSFYKMQKKSNSKPKFAVGCKTRQFSKIKQASRITSCKNNFNMQLIFML
jgi:hypothetical protein